MTAGAGPPLRAPGAGPRFSRYFKNLEQGLPF